MALLKGGTYVNGDLYVADAIKVNHIKTLSGRNFPYIDIPVSSKVTFKNRPVLFNNEASGLAPAPFKTELSNTQLNVTLDDTLTTLFFTGAKLTSIDFNINNSHFQTDSSNLRLDTTKKEWSFSTT